MSEREEKGLEAEAYFKEWLDKHNIPYMYISQEIDTFSQAFKRLFSGKRPDFVVMIPNFGLIFVDVKSRDLKSEYNTLPIDSIDFKKYSAVHSTFNIPIWFVLSNKQCNYKKWYWISTARLQNLNLKEKQSPISEEWFMPVHSSYFIEISDEEDISKLFSGF